MDFKIEKFANLARIKLTREESKELGKDLKSVLEHIEELKELDIEKTSPMTGGTMLKNVLMDDTEIENRPTGGTENFPEGQSKDGYLKVPKVLKK